jgi:Plasmid pRiA4b ORF-3-like protein
MASRRGHSSHPDNTGRHDNIAAGPVLEQLAAAGAPTELLEALAEAGEIGDVLDRLIASGALPGPEESLASLLDSFGPLTADDCDPLSAELSGYEFLAAVRALGRDTDLPTVLGGMIESAERVGSQEALAMTRVLEVIGPEPVRTGASAAASRLAELGLSDPSWVAALGRPKIGVAFGYGDFFGTQEVVALGFSYGRRQHAISVLIDHGLGGGVKDCYVADRPRRLRSQYEQLADNIGVELRDYPTAEAVAVLEQALAAAPCPAELDQIEDVDIHLDLLRSRLELMRAAAPASKPAREARRGVHRLKITLRGSKPPIWRRIEVASDVPLEQLNNIVQASFGWLGGHLWVFTTADGEYGLPDPELGHLDAARRTLAAVAPRPGDRLRYTYDFGDDWEHEIVVEQVADAGPGTMYPRCLGGRRAAPPDDCGGLWGYQLLLEALADPTHPEHAERMEWLGLETPDDWDPAAFDRARIDAVLAQVADPSRGDERP